MNGEVCCILGICCPPESAARVEALAKEIAKDLKCSPSEARDHARWTLKHFALAPKSLEPFIVDVVKVAQAPKHE